VSESLRLNYAIFEVVKESSTINLARLCNALVASFRFGIEGQETRGNILSPINANPYCVPNSHTLNGKEGARKKGTAIICCARGTFRGHELVFRKKYSGGGAYGSKRMVSNEHFVCVPQMRFLIFQPPSSHHLT
jgi:hypothetical protein